MGYFRGNVSSRVFFAKQYLNISRVADKADRINAVDVQIKQSDSVALIGTLRAGYFTVTAGVAAVNAVEAICAKVRAVSHDITLGTGVMVSLDAKTNAIITGRGIEISLDGKTGGSFTTLIGLRIANNLQANIATTSYALQLYADSFAYTADIQWSSTNLMKYGGAAPTAGTWKKGDIVWSTVAAAGGTAGWICTTAGTPGTWKTFGTVAA